MLYFEHSCLEETLNVHNTYTFRHSKWAYAVLILYCHGRLTEIIKRCHLRNKIKIILTVTAAVCTVYQAAWPPYLATASAYCAWISIDLSAPVSSLPPLSAVPRESVGQT